MKRKVLFYLVLLLSGLGMYAQDCDCEEDEFGFYRLVPNKVVSTSVLVDENKSTDFYSAENLFDASWKSWVEGEAGDGINI